MTISKPPNRDYSNLLNVGVTMADPQIAALTANTIVEEYIAMVFENEIENAQKNQQFLSERLTVLREELRIAEQTLQVYREDQNIVTRSSGPNEVDEELSSLSTRFFDARENRLRQENLNQQLQKLGANGKGWEKLTAISNHSRVTQVQSNLLNLERRKGELSKRYGRRHNTMIALESEIASARQQVNTEVRDIIEGIRNEYKLAQRLERAAEENLNQVRDRKQLRGRNEFELNDLQQDVDAKRQVYAIFLERLNQDGASGPSRNHNLWIADPAVVPKAGHRTSLTKAGLVAFILSFGAAMTLGLFFELTNNTIKTGDDVEKKLKVPLLGFLPLIAGNVEEPGLPLREYITNPESRFSEALRTIRTLITLSSLNSPGVNKLLITSSQSHEGKTSVSLSLAAALGKTSKVLLIDGDLRKPSLERILDQSNHKFFGLADVIAGEATIDEAVQHKESEQFDVMYAGSRTIKPLELLSSHQFRQLIDDLSTRYETIVIDSPPCISVSDAYVISTLVDSIVFVTKSNEVPVPTIRSCINRFSDIDASIAGVLINQIDLDAVHNYGKYQDHYDYHGYGEKISDETDIAKR
jgi:succinoglycan biosynthesis transport protein ExoP